MNRKSLQYAPSLIVGGLALLGVYLLLQLLLAVREIAIVILLGVIVGIALAPMASFLTRFRLPRTISVLLVYLVVASVLALVVWFAIPQVAEEIEAIPETLEVLRDDYEALREDIGLPALEDLEEYARQGLSFLAPSLAAQALTAFSILAYVFTILVVALFFTHVQPQAHSLVLSLFSSGTREQASEVMDHTAERLRGYMLAQLIAMTVIGVATYIGMTLLGIPFPLLLAFIAFLSEILPIIGPWLGFVPALILAATQGWEAMVAVSVFYLVLQQIESNVIQPIVTSRRTDMPALLIIVAIIVGGSLMGILGALAAVPVAIVIQTFVMDVVVPWRQRQVGTAEPDEDGGVEDESNAPVKDA